MKTTVKNNDTFYQTLRRAEEVLDTSQTFIAAEEALAVYRHIPEYYTEHVKDILIPFRNDQFGVEVMKCQSGHPAVLGGRIDVSRGKMTLHRYQQETRSTAEQCDTIVVDLKSETRDLPCGIHANLHHLLMSVREVINALFGKAACSIETIEMDNAIFLAISRLGDETYTSPADTLTYLVNLSHTYVRRNPYVRTNALDIARETTPTFGETHIGPPDVLCFNSEI